MRGDYVTAKTGSKTYPEQAADYFASLAGALLPAPNPPAPASPTRTSAVLTWEPPRAGPPAEGYLISTVHGDPLGETGPGEPRSITITSPNLPLWVAVQSVNGYGNGGVSAPVYLKLARLTPSSHGRLLHPAPPHDPRPTVRQQLFC